MLALLFGLRGTVLLYQGEELGCRSVDLRRDQLRDPVGDFYYPLFKAAMVARTPMPWNADQTNLGFSTGAPWLPLGPSMPRSRFRCRKRTPRHPWPLPAKCFKARKDHASLRDADSRCWRRICHCWLSAAARFCVSSILAAREAISPPPNIASLNLGTVR